MSTKDLQTKVIELKDLKAMQEELAAEITAIEDELKAECVRQGTEEIQAGIFKIRYKTVSSNRFDTKAFKTAHSDLYEQYTKQSMGYRFSVA